MNAANQDKVTALMIPSHKGNIDAIKILLNAGADSNIADANGCTCLNYTIDRHSSKEAHQTISGCDVHANTASEDNITLKVASDKQCSDAISVLVNAGADLNNTDVNGKTYLMYAVGRVRSKEILQVIIHHGGDVNAVDNDRMTALMIACWKGNTNAIDILLNEGADPSIVNANRDVCLTVATDRSLSKDLLQPLIDHGANVNATNNKNVTALMIACWKGNVDAINVLLKAGADSSIANANRDTCLTVATDRCLSKDLLQAIIDHGAEVNATNKQSLTALMLASWKGYVDAINLLLTAGADPNIALAKNDARLTTATDRSFGKKVLQKLVDHDADVNAANKSGVTALWIACHQSDVDAVNVLMSAGVDPNTAHANGDTCLKHGIDRDCSREVFHTIIAHGADVNATNNKHVTALMSACRTKNEESMNILLNAGADPNIADVGSSTCLHDAVHGRCCKQVLQALIDHGAEVNVANKSGVTALWIACYQRDVDAINVLLNAGANPNIDPTNGNTCLHHAVHLRCCKEVLQALIAHGADVNVSNNDKETALLVACQWSNVDVINALLNAGADPNIADERGNTCLIYVTDQLRGRKLIKTFKPLRLPCRTPPECPLRMPWMEPRILLNELTNPNASTAEDICHHFAVYERYCNGELQALIDYDADVNATNDIRDTARLFSHQLDGEYIYYRDLNIPYIREVDCNKILLRLIDNGADVNATNSWNQSAIMIAYHKGNLNIINTFLNAGADPTTVTADGETCLHYAVWGGCSKEAFYTLIDHGADINATNKLNQTALSLACQSRNSADVVNVLLTSEADPNIADIWDDTLLHTAVRHKMHKDTLQAIIDHGVDVNAVNSNGTTAVLRACHAGQSESVGLLLKAGADASIADVHGDTCIHKLFHGECDHEMLQMLLDHGVNVNAKNKNNQTAYMLACEQDNIDAQYALVHAGADPDITLDVRDSSLHNIDNECSSNTTPQTIIQWLNPTKHYLEFPIVQISESLWFNVISNLIYYKFRHAIWRTI